MLKRLSILLLAVLMIVPAKAQSADCCECMFAPRAGQWQFDLVTGQTGYVNDFQGLYYLLPDQNSDLGLGGSATIGGELAQTIFNLGSFNHNNLSNIVGLQAKYFITNHIDINLMASYDLNLQPSKNYEEGTTIYDPTIGEIDNDLFIPGQKAIQGVVTNKLNVRIGSNYYFNHRNPRVSTYLGIFGGFQMARIEAFYPYTGEYAGDDEELAIYRAGSRAGQILAFQGGLVAGVAYSILPGLQFGFEVAPVAYQYSLLHLQVSGLSPYYACNHDLKAFAFPQFKVGIRF